MPSKQGVCQSLVLSCIETLRQTLGPRSPASVRINSNALLLFPARIRVLNPCVDGDVVLATSAAHGMAARSNDEEALLLPAAVAMGVPSPRPAHATGESESGSEPESG